MKELQGLDEIVQVRSSGELIRDAAVIMDKADFDGAKLLQGGIMNGKLSWGAFVNFATNSTQGIRAMHSKEIAHLDIKAEISSIFLIVKSWWYPT